MPISSLNDLKQNKTFVLLNNVQSQYDARNATDQTVENNKFTRSPLHVVPFLIAYAGLAEHERASAVTKLRQLVIKVGLRNFLVVSATGVWITNEQLDALVDDIDWVTMLQAPSNSTLKLQFTLSLPNRLNFFSAIANKCPNLHQALTSTSSIVKIEEAAQVVFSTSISQEELWAQSFAREDAENFWRIPNFNLSPTLKKTVEALYEYGGKQVGCFDIRKGAGALARDIEVRVVSPDESNQYFISSNIEAQPGIYSAFLGLTNFYGLERLDIDNLVVKVENEANFSDIGAYESQTQVNKTLTAYPPTNHENHPTIIWVRDLHVFFEGTDIVTSFTEGNFEATGPFNSQLYIGIPTQSEEGTFVTLLAQAPKARDILSLKEISRQRHREAQSLIWELEDAGIWGWNTESTMPTPIETVIRQSEPGVIAIAKDVHELVNNLYLRADLSHDDSGNLIEVDLSDLEQESEQLQRSIESGITLLRKLVNELHKIQPKYKNKIDDIIETLRPWLEESNRQPLTLGSKMFKAYQAKYLEAFECPANTDEEEFKRHLCLRSRVAIDWAIHDAPGFEERLALRLAYDLKHPEPLSSTFIFKLLEQLFNSDTFGHNKFVAMGEINRAFIMFSVLTLVGAGVAAGVSLVVTASLIPSISILLAVSAGGVFLGLALELAVGYLYNKFSIPEKFISTDDERADSYIYPHARVVMEAKDDRHLRPWDRLGLFKSVKASVQDVLPTEQNEPALSLM